MRRPRSRSLDEIVADRSQDLPEDVDGRGEFLDRSLTFCRRLAMDAGHGLSDARLGSGDRQSGDEVGDSGSPHAWGPGVDADAASVFRCEEDDEIGGRGGERRRPWVSHQVHQPRKPER
jgi:hypothetical protein